MNTKGTKTALRAAIVLLLLIVLGGVLSRFLYHGSPRHFARRLLRGELPPVGLRTSYPPTDNEIPMFGKTPFPTSRNSWDVQIEQLLATNAPAATDRDAYLAHGWQDAALRDDFMAQSFGALAWERCVAAELTHPEMTVSAAVQRLCCWCPALETFCREHVYKEAFVRRVVGTLQQDANRVAGWLSAQHEGDFTGCEAAAALLAASIHMNGLSGCRKWRAESDVFLLRFFQAHQAKDGTINADTPATIAVFETVMPALAVCYRSGYTPPNELTRRMQALGEFPLYTLDANGCPPFTPPDQYFSANKREWLYWAGLAFRRDDFLWAAYGGLEMPEARPPVDTCRAFPDAGIYVLRNNWEIRRMVRRAVRSASLDDPKKWPTDRALHSNQLVLDVKHATAEIFANGVPQLRLLISDKPLQMVAWRVESNCVAQCVVSNATIALTVRQLPQSEDGWTLQMTLADRVNRPEIRPLLTTLSAGRNQQELVTAPMHPRLVSHHIQDGLSYKTQAGIFVTTDGVFDMREGCYLLQATTGANMCSLRIQTTLIKTATPTNSDPATGTESPQ